MWISWVPLTLDMSHNLRSLRHPVQTVGLPELGFEALRAQLGACWVGVWVGSLSVLAPLSLTSVLTLSFSRYCFTQPIPWDLWEVSHSLAPHQCPHPWWLLLYVRSTRPCTQSACGTLAYPCSCAQGPLRLHPSVRTTGVGSLVSQDRVLHWLEFRSCCLP